MKGLKGAAGRTLRAVTYYTCQFTGSVTRKVNNPGHCYVQDMRSECCHLGVGNIPENRGLPGGQIPTNYCTVI